MEDAIKIEHGDHEIVEVHCEPPRKKQTVLSLIAIVVLPLHG